MARPTLLDVAFSLPRYLLPRGIPNRSSHLIRHASSTPTKNASKGPRVLAKPTKYTPPSHPARLPRAVPINFPGPPLSAKEIAAQKTKQYPHMMPAEGTFMRWFLTNRSIHIYITLVKHLSSGVCMLMQTSREALHLLILVLTTTQGTLFSLALYTFIVDFRRSSPFTHLLPAKGWILRAPVSGARQWLEVYKLTVEERSREAGERRRRGVEDVAKRREYRVAMGLEEPRKEGDVGGGLLDGWLSKEKKLQDVVGDEGDAQSPLATATIADQAVSATGNVDGSVDPSRLIAEGGPSEAREPVRRKPLKKWLGIW